MKNVTLNNKSLNYIIENLFLDLFTFDIINVRGKKQVRRCMQVFFLNNENRIQKKHKTI